MTRPLTLRQREVVTLIRAGRPYMAIAATLGVSWRTIEGHVNRIALRVPGDATPYRRVLMAADELLGETEEYSASGLDRIA